MGSVLTDTVIQLSLNKLLTGKRKIKKTGDRHLCYAEGERGLRSKKGGEEGWRERTDSVVQFVYARMTPARSHTIHTHIDEHIDMCVTHAK